jgi:leukotriene-A4 hydrolase
MARHDPHSYADDAQARVSRFSLEARVDFEAQVLDCRVLLSLSAPRAGPLDLDTRGLTIARVTTPEGHEVPFVLHPEEPILGARLSLTLPEGCTAVRVEYRTSPQATALQWLPAAQTSSGRLPFLFTQCQALHARSVVPLQDSPRHRVTYRAALTVPRALEVVMAAARVGREEQGELAVARFDMPQAIPPYLFAFAVGELQARDLSGRTRVWAEPAQVEAAAAEFAKVEQLMVAAEGLFGPYDWERFDLLVMPPSFPYGGMENPRLTFLTPTLIAGDGSLVDVVAHELAHSWTGNLVTNANAEHFWLNEGFTVYAERRIMEAVRGAEVMALSAALGRRALDEAVRQLADRPGLSRLRTHLAGVDPDEVSSVVPYEKGFLFLVALERAVGRQRFDAMLASYLGAHRFGAVTTEDFMVVVRREFPGLLERVGAPAWLDEDGVPANAPVFRSARLAALEALGARPPGEELARTFSPTEWVLWLDRLPRPLGPEVMRALDARFGFTRASNMEVAVAWLKVVAASGYRPAFERLEGVLRGVGRMKYLRPLYRALGARPETRAQAQEWFEGFKGRYHPIARHVVEVELGAARRG